jgi:Penicillinase repressor.
MNELSIDEIKIIQFLQDNEFINNTKVRELINKKETTAKTLLGKLVAKNIIEPIGEKRNRRYRLIKH